jgi:hypothetical protein
VQIAHFPIDYIVICHQNGGLNDNLLLVYYAGECDPPPPPILWRLWLSYKSKHHCEKYENFLTSGFEHYHFPLMKAGVTDESLENWEKLEILKK